jgi:hypothetical protein
MFPDVRCSLRADEGQVVKKIQISHREGQSSGNSRFVPGRFSVQISTDTPAILTQHFRDVPQVLYAATGIVQGDSFERGSEYQ